MSDLKIALRKALAGSSSQKPVTAEVLVISALKKCSSATTEDMVRALEELLACREINTASSTKGAITTVMYWLTGSIGLTPAFYITHPAALLPGAKVQPKTSIPTQKPKEKIMSKKTAKARISPITQAILDLVGEQPGINRDALQDAALKRAPDATPEQANKGIQNLLHASKKIRVQMIDEDRCYFLNSGTKLTATPKARPAPAKEVKASKHANPLPDSKPTNCAKKKFPTDDDLAIYLGESGDIHITVGQMFIKLIPEHASRVQRFIGRINPERVFAPA